MSTQNSNPTQMTDPSEHVSSKGPLRAFASPQFRLFWLASLASIVSFFMTTIARGWLVLDMTDSAFLVTAINAVAMLPTLVFALYGGVIADRINRRLVLIVSDGFGLIAVSVLAGLVFSDVVELWQVFSLTLIHGTAFAIGMPARAALVSNLVSGRDMASAVAMFTTIFSAGQMVGPGVAGYLITSYGMASPFMMSCLLLVPALLLLLGLKPPVVTESRDRANQASIWESIKEALQYVRQHRVMLGLILMGVAATVFAMPYQTLLPVFARDVLDVGASGLGWLGAMSGVGAIAGSVTVASLSNPRPMKLLMFVGSIGLGVFIVLFATSTNYILSLFLVLCLGFLFQIFMTSNFTFVQLIAPDYIRGRVLSIRMIAFGLSPAGMILLGTGAEIFGPATATMIAGTAAVILVALIIIVTPALRKVEVAAQEQIDLVRDQG